MVKLTPVPLLPAQVEQSRQRLHRQARPFLMQAQRWPVVFYPVLSIPVTLPPTRAIAPTANTPMNLPRAYPHRQPLATTTPRVY